MYIPKYFEQKDRKSSIAFMQAYHFGILVSTQEQLPIATHLPFLIEERDNKIVLVSHLSKANKQWKTFDNNNVLVIFSEPHAYISPTLYEHQQNVPTWNYVAVHAYGKAIIFDTQEEKLTILRKQMQQYEADYLKQFDTLDKKYINELLKGIVAFEIVVDKLQAKEKLSQNKTATERKNIINHLAESKDSIKQNLAILMKNQK